MPETVPPQEPMIVRLPLIKFYLSGDKVVGEVIGSTPVPPGEMNGRYLGPNGYTTIIDDATDFRGAPGMNIVQGQTVEVAGPKGDPGADGKSALVIWQEQGNAGGVAAFLASLKGEQGNQGTPGLAGRDGVDGRNGIDGKDGAPGTNGTNGIDGKSVELQATATAIQWRQVGGTWADLIQLSALKGAKGDTGASGATLVGQVVVGQNATVAIALGIREVTVALSGAVVGERYIAFARSYRLNGGASVNGRPPSYTVLDCACNTAGQITVSLNAPLLAIGSSYAITTDIVRINAS